MKTHELRPPQGSRRPRKRVGRGNGSGSGTTAGVGGKGQKGRSGAKIPSWFEGGQMPLQRRIPKRGFDRSILQTPRQAVNVGQFARFEDETEFTVERMAALGLIDPDGGPVKVLAKGAVARAIKVEADAFSVAARDAIEAAGGTAVVRERS